MNELEILKNESAEKDRTLMEYKHFIQLEIHQRDRRHAKLNKFEVKKREKKAILDQQINEIEKQNMILHSLEKEMKDLRHKYEVLFSMPIIFHLSPFFTSRRLVKVEITRVSNSSIVTTSCVSSTRRQTSKRISWKTVKGKFKS